MRNNLIYKHKCNICKKISPSHLVLNNIPPLQNYYTQTEEMSLLINKIDVDFVWCNDCFHVSIKKKQKNSFDENYNSEVCLGADLTQLKKVYNIIKKKITDKSKKIIEIGCGRGALLELLSKSGFSNIQGYDPVMKNEYNKLISAEYWNGGGYSEPDLIILRQTLEEIPRLDNFLSLIKKKNVKNLYIEITNISNFLKNDDPFSLFPECENLFSITSLSKIMAKFEYVLDDVNMFFEGNWAGCWFRMNDTSKNIVNSIKSYKINIRNLEKPIVLWGAGGRGSNILSFCELHKNDIGFVIDLNKAKIGKYMPPNGQKIISPDELCTINPKTIIVSSSKFLKNIKSYLKKNIKSYLKKEIKVLRISQLKLNN